MSLRLTPVVLPGDTRRRLPFEDTPTIRRVPLWTVDPGGQLFQGIIRVPLELCHSEQHTNAGFKFDKLIAENLERWTTWRKLRGWHIAERPRVSGPYDPPQEDKAKSRKFFARAKKQIGRAQGVREITDFEAEAEYKWYIAEARFTREEPVYARLEDMIELRHMALKYDVDPDRDPLPYSDLPEPEDEIAVDGGIDPMQEAEESRQERGLRREDYLIGKLEEPL